MKGCALAVPDPWNRYHSLPRSLIFMACYCCHPLFLHVWFLGGTAPVSLLSNTLAVGTKDVDAGVALAGCWILKDNPTTTTRRTLFGETSSRAKEVKLFNPGGQRVWCGWGVEFHNWNVPAPIIRNTAKKFILSSWTDDDVVIRYISDVLCLFGSTFARLVL